MKLFHISPMSHRADILREGLISSAPDRYFHRDHEGQKIYAFTSAWNALAWGALYFWDEYAISGSGSIEAGMDLWEIDADAHELRLDPAAVEEDRPDTPSAILNGILLEDARVIQATAIRPSFLRLKAGFLAEEAKTVLAQAYISNLITQVF